MQTQGLYATRQALENSLSEVLKEFKALYDEDVERLLEKIPEKEVWRFFIDGDRQCAGTRLKARLLQAGAEEKYCSDSLVDFMDHLEFIEGTTQDSSQLEELSQQRGVIRRFLEDYTLAREQIDEESVTFNQFCDMLDGWSTFEVTEPGYLTAMITGQKLFDSAETVDVDFIKSLHASALKDVKKTNYDTRKQKEKPGNFRIDNFGMNPLSSSIADEAGLRSILEEMKSMPAPAETSENKQTERAIPAIYYRDGKTELEYVILPDWLAEKYNNQTNPVWREKFDNSFPFVTNKKLGVFSAGETLAEYPKLIPTLVYGSPTDLMALFINTSKGAAIQEAISGEIRHYLAEFYSKMKSNDLSKLDRLLGIAKLIQKCERLHPFYDGNTRTFSMLLLKRLLKFYGFPPTILDEPNGSIGFSLYRFVGEIIKGMKKTLQLAKGESVNNIVTDKLVLSDEQQKYFETLLKIEQENRKAAKSKSVKKCGNA